MFWIRHKKQVIVGMVTTLLAAAAIGGFTFLWHTTALQGLMGLLGEWLKAGVAVSRFALALIFFAGAGTSVFLSWLISKQRKCHERHYDKDVINGLAWEWNSLNVYERLEPLKPLCPHCLAELYVKNDSHNAFVCVMCMFHREYRVAYRVLKDFAKNEIERRIRTGECKGATRRLKLASRGKLGIDSKFLCNMTQKESE